MGHFGSMLSDKNSERLMLAGRIRKTLSHIEATYLYPDSERVGGFLFRDGQHDISEISEGDWRPFDDENETWGYPECYAWFKHTITVPERFKGMPLIYEVLPYHSGRWNTVNPQLILFADGKLIQGMDSNHRFVRLTDCAQGGEKIDIALNAHTDAREFKGKLLMRARLRAISDIAMQIYFDIATPFEAAELFGTDELARVDIIKALNEAVNLLEFNEGQDAFENSAVIASQYLEDTLYADPDCEDALVSCIGHTHIDVAWLWRLRQTRDKAGRSFGTVLKLMEEYPDYKFMSSQAQLYDYVKKDYPQVYEGIKERIAQGRWEPEGSMWVEADTNVTSGESLVRQFLVGKRFFADEFGVENKIMWLPDVFGYSAALPQIMKRSGIDYFMTTKISWNEYDKVPYDTFMWKGIDGSSVLSHFIPSTGDMDESNNFMTTYNSYLSPREVIGGWRRYSQKDLNRNVLSSFGYGDGGGGPTFEMLEHAKRLEKGVPGCPKTKMEFSLDFFKRLESETAGNRHLPEWAGELYLEFHRGTLTSQARNKKYNRKSEVLYHDIETLASLAMEKCGSEYPFEALNEGWKIILLNQFHDIIPGSSIKEVYEDSKLQYEELLADGNRLLLDAQQDIADSLDAPEGSLIVFNTLGAERTDVVVTEMPALASFEILDCNGKSLPWQKTWDGKLCFLAENVPSKGYKAFTVKADGASPEGAVKVDGKRVSTPFLSAEFDEAMNLSSLVHLASGREVAPEGEVLGKILAFEDMPFNHEAWDIKPYVTEKSWEIDNVESAQLIENGSVRAVWKIERKFRKSTIVQYYVFYSALERVDVLYDIDWKEREVLLKADYPVDVNAQKATFDIQFGNIERSAHNNTLWDFAQFEVSGHKWADLSDNSFGLAVLNDCKYGWTVKDGRIRPSLLRCAVAPNTEQDRERHTFTYSLYPHAGKVCDSDVVKEGYSLNYPLHCSVKSTVGGSLKSEYSLVACDAPNVVIETVKKAEDSEALVIRMYETWNKKTDVTLNFGKAFSKITECDLMENDEKSLGSGSSLSLTFKPFEIKTVKII